ncbi:MAG: hypothetical protein WA047_19655 [Phenylobacterium sp.]
MSDRAVFWLGAGLGLLIAIVVLAQGYVWIDAYVRDSGVFPVNVALYADICARLSPNPQPSREVCVSRGEAVMSPLPPFLREKE